jgi:hypothetical protein
MAFKKIIDGSALPKGVETADNVNSIIESTVETSLAALVGSAPAVLDTLEELSTALGNDENFATTVTTALSNKSNTGHGHAISDVAGLQIGLNEKASSSHSHAISDVANLQTSLDGKAPLASPAFTGSVDFTGATVTGIDSLPSQSGNSGKYLTTNGTSASWSTVESSGGTANDNTILKAALFFGGN